MNDLRYACRMLLKSPGFTIVAIATLALGIGLNTAIVSLINDLFLRPLSFKEPDRLVRMYSNARERNLLELNISIPRFEHFRDSQTVFENFGAENLAIAFTLTGLGDPQQLLGGQVTSNWFDILGVRPIRGRKHFRTSCWLPVRERSTRSWMRRPPWPRQVQRAEPVRQVQQLAHDASGLACNLQERERHHRAPCV